MDWFLYNNKKLNEFESTYSGNTCNTFSRDMLNQIKADQVTFYTDYNSLRT